MVRLFFLQYGGWAKIALEWQAGKPLKQYLQHPAIRPYGLDGRVDCIWRTVRSPVPLSISSLLKDGDELVLMQRT